MMALKKFGMGFAVAGLLSVVLVAQAEAACKSVKGRITSDLVAVFADGTPCPSPLGLCTEGRYTGRLKGGFSFVANTLVPYAAQDPAAPPDVAATTGVVELSTRFCDGTLVLGDTSAFSLGPDGFFGGVQTVDGGASDGGCFGATGRIHLSGVFLEGCVDCGYEGEVCTLGDGDKDKDKDDD